MKANTHSPSLKPSCLKRAMAEMDSGMIWDILKSPNFEYGPASCDILEYGTAYLAIIKIWEFQNVPNHFRIHSGLLSFQLGHPEITTFFTEGSPITCDIVRPYLILKKVYFTVWPDVPWDSLKLSTRGKVWQRHDIFDIWPLTMPPTSFRL